MPLAKVKKVKLDMDGQSQQSIIKVDLVLDAKMYEGARMYTRQCQEQIAQAIMSAVNAVIRTDNEKKKK